LEADYHIHSQHVLELAGADLMAGRRNAPDWLSELLDKTKNKVA
jgi:hypothetical protein